MSADDILLQTLEVVDTASDGGFAEDLGCLLNDAAEMKLFVFNAARVIPWSTWLAVAGLASRRTIIFRP